MATNLAERPDYLDNPSPMVVKILDGEAVVEVPMSVDQQSAVRGILEHKEQFYRLCGGAGVGKSAIIEYLANELDAKVTATTARAALNVGGCTVDGLFAFRRRDWKINESRQRHNMGECPDWVIIDEASMIGTKMAEIIYAAAVRYDKGVILVGDWAQAPPVKDTWPVGQPLLEEGETYHLTKNHRQGEGQYLDVLQEIRQGRVSREAHTMFASRVYDSPSDDAYTYMYGTNRSAEYHNSTRLKQVAEHSRCPIVVPKAEYQPVDEYAPDRDDIIEDILTGCRLSHRSEYCVGAKVMTTINNYQAGFVNGDIGRVTGYFSAYERSVLREDLLDALDGHTKSSGVFFQKYDPPIGDHVVGLRVWLERNKREVIVGQMEEEMHKPNGKLSYTINGLPIRLAYALTVHKTQGATLDRAYLAMDSLWPEHGLAYVGLSRTKTIDGLFLHSWRPDFIQCDPVIVPYI